MHDDDTVVREAQRASLYRQLENCHDRTARAELAVRILGCAAPRLKVEGRIWCARGRQVSLGQAVYLCADGEIWDDGPVQIGDCTVCGPRFRIRAAPDQGVVIGRRVWLGEDVEVAPGTTIGDDAVICAKTRISGHVPPRAIIAGNPPQVLRTAR